MKVSWYKEYGVRECWVVDPLACQIEVIKLAKLASPEGASCVYNVRQVVRSMVLPRLRLRPADVCED